MPYRKVEPADGEPSGIHSIVLLHQFGTTGGSDPSYATIYEGSSEQMVVVGLSPYVLVIQDDKVMAMPRKDYRFWGKNNGHSPGWVWETKTVDEGIKSALYGVPTITFDDAKFEVWADEKGRYYIIAPPRRIKSNAAWDPNLRVARESQPSGN